MLTIMLAMSLLMIQVQDPNYNSETECDSVCYSEEDLYWLSRLIYAEAGADYCSDELQLAVGSVVLNRVESDLYPDTIKDVIFDTKHTQQYGCVTNGMIYRQPDSRAIENSTKLLSFGQSIPKNVMAQSDIVFKNNIYKTIDGVVFSYVEVKSNGKR